MLGLCVALLIVMIEFGPFVWVVLTSFKEKGEIFRLPPRLIFSPTLTNYVASFVNGPFGKYLINSLIVDILAVALAVIAGTLAAYAFSRFELFGKKHIFFYILTTRMCPPIVIALPLFLMYSNLGLRDTRFGLIMIHAVVNLALVTWLMRGFFDEIPIEIDQAAMLDGYGEWHIFWKFVLPPALPGVVVSAVFSAIFSWNEFLFALILTQSQAATLPVGIPQLVTSRGIVWGQIAAVATVMAIPVFVFTVVFQKYLVRGLTFGAVKT
jgi:multiple sugar transport system permease protein